MARPTVDKRCHMARYSGEMGNSIQQQIEQLRREIEHHDRRYYVLNQPEIADQQYDRLLSQLKTLETQHPELITSDSPTQRVSGKPLEGFVTVAHNVPMLSMDNTYSADELRQFDGRVRKALGDKEIQYAVETKIDGVAVSLRYENDRLVLATTRGDGMHGDDITSNIRAIRAIPLRLAKKQTQEQMGLFDSSDEIIDVLEVRGEVFMSDSQFQRVNKDRSDSGLQLFANPRNASAGSLKLLDSSIVAGRGLSFLAYSLGQADPPIAEAHMQMREKLRQLAIPVNPHCQLAGDIEEVIDICNQWQRGREELDYPVDGMVVKVNNFLQRQTLGETSRSPRWCIAYKFAAEQVQTVVSGITIQVGKTGALTPVADLEPVQLAGTTVSRASLHNFDELARKDVRVGDTVTVEKAGEIIPQVVEVDFEKRPSGTKPIARPGCCPQCNGAIKEDENVVAIRCVNPGCPAQLVERIRHFAGRNQMDIEGLGIAIVEQLVQRQLVKSFADLYRLDQLTLASLDRMGEKSAANLIKALQESKKRPLAKVLAALGIFHVGSNAAEVLAKRFCSIEKLMEADAEQLQEVDEIGPIIAESVYAFIHTRETRKLIDDLIDVGLEMPGPDAEAGPKTAMLLGKTVVVTGSVEGYSRNDIQELIKLHGGKTSSSVSKKTDMVVVGGNPGTKVAKAEKLSVQIVDAREFLDSLG